MNVISHYLIPIIVITHNPSKFISESLEYHIVQPNLNQELIYIKGGANKQNMIGII